MMMMKMELVPISLLVGMALLCVAAGQTTVRCSDGPGMGCVSGVPFGNNTIGFQGIRFAQPAVGSLRWRPPQPIDPIVPDTGNPQPPQQHQECLARTRTGYIGSEAGCLTVDVFTPDNVDANDSLPVMYWIHGGSFMDFAPNYECVLPTKLIGESMDNAQDVIVVIVNYRMGGLGFMGSEYLQAEDANHSSGNYGIFDQIAGLEWVQENIGYFGGDKNRVTIFGESAGAYSVCVLLASPLSVGLFAHASMDSAYCDLGYIYQSNAIQIGAACMDRYSCTTIQCLRDLNESDAYFCNNADFVPGTQTMPNIDGYLLLEPPVDAIGGANVPSVPVLLGSNRNELMAFIISSTAFTPWNLTEADRPDSVVKLLIGEFLLRHSNVPPQDYLTVFSQENILTALSLYPVSDYEVFADKALPYFETVCHLFDGPCDFTASSASVVAMATDIVFTSTAYSIANKVNTGGQPAYRYLFGENMTGSLLQGLPILGDVGSFHSLDVAFLFGNFEEYADIFTATWTPTSSDQQLSQAMMKYYINFANTGNPNTGSDGLPNWPQWTGPATDPIPEYMRLIEPGLTTGSGFAQNRIDFWLQINQVVLAHDAALASSTSSMASSSTSIPSSTTTASTTSATASSSTASTSSVTASSSSSTSSASQTVHTSSMPSTVATVSTTSVQIVNPNSLIDNGSKKLSAGDDVGITIGALLVVVLVVILAAFACGQRKKVKQSFLQESVYDVNPSFGNVSSSNNDIDDYSYGGAVDDRLLP